MPSININEQNTKKVTLSNKLRENNAQIYTDMIVNSPTDPNKGASFQVADSFRTPQYVAGAQDVYGKPLDIQKGNMDYIAAFAKDGIEKLQAVTKSLDPNNEKGLLQPNTRFVNGQDTGELTGYSSNKLAGSVTLQGADGENYRLSIQQKNIADEATPYRPSKTEIQIYGDMGNPNKPSKTQVFSAEISVAKQDKETNEYSKEMGKVMLWGQMDQRGKLVPSEVEKNGAVVNNYFSLAKNQDTKAFMLTSQLIKDGFSYTPAQREMEKNNPDLKNEPRNISFRIMDKDVAKEIKNSFVKTAEEVTKDTTRSIAQENSKSMFINVTLDTASTQNAEGKSVAKTTAIITPAVWTTKEHEVDYSKHIAKVDPQYGQKTLTELGANMNKAVEAYTASKDKGKAVAENSVTKNVEKAKIKSKAKSKDLEY